MASEAIGSQLRIVIVDDDEWRRRGVADAVSDLGGLLSLQAAVTTRQALASPVGEGCDVVLFHTDATAEWDHYPGIGVAARLRKSSPTVRRLLLVAPPGSPLLPLRASEAGVTHFYRTSTLGTMSALERALLLADPECTPSGAIDRALLRSLGLSLSSRLNEGLAFVDESGLRPALNAPYAAMSRRRGITIRTHLANIMDVKPVSAGSGSVVEPKTPTWRQLSAIVNLARGSTTRHQPEVRREGTDTSP